MKISSKRTALYSSINFHLLSLQSFYSGLKFCRKWHKHKLDETPFASADAKEISIHLAKSYRSEVILYDV